MPHIEDFTTICWEDGPLRYAGMTNPPLEAVLCLQSGTIGIAIDTKSMQLLHAGRFDHAVDMETTLQRGTTLVNALQPLALKMSITDGADTFTCTGRAPLSADDLRFPVRLVESGHFFQRVAIEELEFFTAQGRRFKAKGRAEFSLWPDRLTLTVALIPDNEATLNGELSVRVNGHAAATRIGTTASVTIPIFDADASPRASVVTQTDGMRAEWDNELRCHVIHTPLAPWKNNGKTYFPVNELDRLERWSFTLSNASDSEAVAPVLFIPDNPQQLTGDSAILCDADGTPTGIPVQISKNWHANPALPDVIHQGAWIHAFSWVHLPPHSRREFTFELAYAQYGGIPAASHVQLCLLGWASHQLWEQAALGSFGESICFDPYRFARRCSITDLRPFMTLSTPATPPYGWADNCGGGDFLMWLDANSRYPGFGSTRSDYRSQGPCLTDVEYAEVTRGGAIASRISVSLMRSDDHLRVIQHLRYDVRKPVTWTRLAFYQMGADFYNSPYGHLIASGDTSGLQKEWQPPEGTGAYQHRDLKMTGANPWISLHGINSVALQPSQASANRGLIVRSWNAVLGGRPCPHPYASVYAYMEAPTSPRLLVELSPPPELTQLCPGDFVDAEVELVVFPSKTEAYYGPNAAFKHALKLHADTWSMTQREARGNTLEISTDIGALLHRYPLAFQVDDADHAAFSATGGEGFVPLTFRDLKAHRGYELLIGGKTFSQALHGNDFWQTNFDPVTRRWSITYNVPPPASGMTFDFHPDAK